MKGILKRLKKTQTEINKEISGNSIGLYGGGLASEGYAGGYRDALSDVSLLLRGVEPSDRGRHWWSASRPASPKEAAE